MENELLARLILKKTAFIIMFFPTLSLMSCVSTVPAPAFSVSTCENSQTEIGKSSYTVLFGMFKFGDGSITAAMGAGNIDSVHHIDIQTEEYFFFRKVSVYIIGAGNKKKASLPLLH